MHQVAHSNTIEVLTLSFMSAEPDTPRYWSTYAKYFMALVTKKVVKQTLDSRALTPSVMGMDEYLMPDPVVEGATVPPVIQPPAWGNLTFADPMSDKAMAQIHVLQLEGKYDEALKCNCLQNPAILSDGRVPLYKVSKFQIIKILYKISF